MKFPGRNTTKSNTGNGVLNGKLKTGMVTGGKQFSVLITHLIANNRADHMDDILTGQIVSVCYLRHACWLRFSLSPHNFCTGVAKLDTRKRMNGVVNTGMARDKTTGHAAVGGVDNSVSFERGNIAAL
jgi:hypothetical protein